jgi:hypothetical protein
VIPRRIAARAANPGRWLALLLLASACSPEGSLGRDGVSGTGSGEGTSSGSSDATSRSSESGSGSGSSDSTSTSTSTSESSDSTGAAVCEPVGDETECMICLLGHCCDVQQACAADEMCTCALECVEQTGADSVDACTMSHCAGSADAFMPSLECAHTHCAAACPWAT